MELVDIQQQSPEWFTWRSGKIGASDAATIMGDNPWKTPYKLWKEKVGLDPSPFISDAMMHGAKTEPKARQIFEDMMELEFPPACVQSTEYEWAIASLDGLSSSGEIVEIKCPFSKDRFFEMILNNKVPKEYYGQLQHQMMVTGLSFVHFFAYFGGETFYQKVDRDENYIKNLIEAEQFFYECMQNGDAPDHASHDLVENLTPEWIELSTKLKKTVEKRRELEAIEDTIRQEILTLANEQPTKGSGVTVFSQVRKGGLNLRELELDMKVSGLNLDDYRKPDTKSWIVKVSD